MTVQFAYDSSVDPPAPVALVRVSPPAGDDVVMVPMLVDTGAGCTLVPASVVRRLGLPRIDVISVTGVGGARMRSTVHAAQIEVGPVCVVARVVAFADEAILGRDVLNQVFVALDGPNLALSMTRTPRPRRRRRPT